MGRELARCDGCGRRTKSRLHSLRMGGPRLCDRCVDQLAYLDELDTRRDYGKVVTLDFGRDPGPSAA
jgi:hypothetical protein